MSSVNSIPVTINFISYAKKNASSKRIINFNSIEDIHNSAYWNVENNLFVRNIKVTENEFESTKTYYVYDNGKKRGKYIISIPKNN